MVYSRDLMRDAYFGIQARGRSMWLNSAETDLDATGYDGDGTAVGRDGGTNIIRVEQTPAGMGLVTRTRVFAPWGLESQGFVMLLEVQNVGTDNTGPVKAYSLLNANLGYGRPGPRSEIGADFETITLRPDGSLLEQGFAGLIHAIPLVAPARTSHTPAAFFDAVASNAGDIPTPATTGTVQTGAAGAFQWNIADIPPGESAWVGVLVAYDANPDFVDGRRAASDAWVAGRSPAQIWLDEVDGWNAFQASLDIPAGIGPGDLDVYRHGATVLRMAQVRETQAFLRPQIDRGVPRFTGIDNAVTAVPAGGIVREHKGFGAVLASLPPGEWAYAWVRDGAYAIVGMADAGMDTEAREALAFFLNADADRYRTYEELASVPLLPYALSVTRYMGFGLEESDTLCNGDFNFEWDGFGLYAWALKHYVDQTGDLAFAADHWDQVRDGVGDVIIGLEDPDTGVMWGDSSIWEVHWTDFKAKRFTYTALTAARGLCDLGALAEQLGEVDDAERYNRAGRRMRHAIWEHQRDASGALVANIEELATGTGYWDAAVVDAISMGLFAPDGETSVATLAALRRELTAANGRGLFRNDDAFDAHGLSPYGSDYDNVEWVVLDLRASIAARHMEDNAYADFLQQWVSDQTQYNYLLVGETYDQNTGVYRNNAPMIGFGSGSWISAMWQRHGGRAVEPACGVYFEDDPEFGPGSGIGDDVGADTGADTGTDTGDDTGTDTAVDTGTDTAVDTGTDADADTSDDVGADTAADGADDTATDTVDGDVADTAVADALDTAPDDTGGGDAAIDTGDGAADATADTVRDTNPGGADTSINEPEPGSSGGCSAAPGAASWPAAGLGALLAVAVARRRRAIR
jgi:hypothetical protein